MRRSEDNNKKYSARTVSGYRKILDTLLKQHFGETTLPDYSTGMGTNWITSLNPKFSRTSLQHIRAVGFAIFSHAIATEALGKGALPFNPWHGVRNLAKPKDAGETPHYTLAEIQAILNALGDCTVKHTNTNKNGYGFDQSCT